LPLRGIHYSVNWETEASQQKDAKNAKENNLPQKKWFSFILFATFATFCYKCIVVVKPYVSWVVGVAHLNLTFIPYIIRTTCLDFKASSYYSGSQESVFRNQNKTTKTFENLVVLSIVAPVVLVDHRLSLTLAVFEGH